MMMQPIGFFHCCEKYSYDAARQGSLGGENRGVVQLEAGMNYEQALQDLASFSHLWLIYQFHENTHWKPLVQPPRGTRKVGLFASRAPYRPNPIGLSCVRLISVRGRRVEVAGHDLLDGAPILDIKPYLHYADSMPQASLGWLETIEEEAWIIRFSSTACDQLDWLGRHQTPCLQAFIEQQLAHQPLNRQRKRLRFLAGEDWEIAYRTWRVRFTIHEASHAIEIQSIYSGYTEAELKEKEDRYADKEIHRAYRAQYNADDQPE